MAPQLPVKPGDISIPSAARSQMSTSKIIILVLGLIIGSMALMAFVSVMYLWPALEQANYAAKKTHSKNNLQQMGLALHNFHDIHNSFPSGVEGSKVGLPNHSWMTNLLPFVEQTQLFEEIDQDKSWNAPENQKVFSQSIPAFISSSARPEQQRVGELGAAHYAGNSNLLGPNTARRLKSIKDGSSNTILAGEVATGFKAWGDPGNVRNPADGFGQTATQFGDIEAGTMTLMLFADGSVHAIPTTIQQETLRALATPDGNDQVGEF